MENQHEKDLLLHFAEKNNIVVGRTWYDESRNELIINTATVETTTCLLELLLKNGALNTQSFINLTKSIDP